MMENSICCKQLECGQIDSKSKILKYTYYYNRIYVYISISYPIKQELFFKGLCK